MGVRVVGKRGAKRRLVLEAQYWELILSGVGPVEAAKRVGIGRKTGYRWRHENGGLPPSRISDEIRSDRYLSLLERQRIATLRERGLSIREVVRRLGRAASTVSREVRRNTLRSRPRPLRRRPRAFSGCSPCLPAPPGPAADRSSTAGCRSGQAGTGLESAADQCLASPRIPCATGLAYQPRDDLPKDPGCPGR
ncbi:helix-turn-helix domain-containing protein [Nocardia sp. NPDC049190]|uniref:helix-turn-helix domain-containing protein n=1 Tax=Nocardia sp. NPDC049190 TaxID=3155650 RepID=UPI0033D9440C